MRCQLVGESHTNSLNKHRDEGCRLTADNLAFINIT